MNFIKKTLFAGLAIATLAGAGTSMTTSQANATSYYGGGYHYNYYPTCFYKWVWKRNYNGYLYKKRIKVCH